MTYCCLLGLYRDSIALERPQSRNYWLINMDLEFRGSVALSNMGVLMLERKCFEQARDTFRAALKSLRILAKQKRKDSSSSNKVSDVTEELRLAMQRLVNPNASKTNVPMIVLSTGDQEAQDSTVFDSILVENEVNSTIYPTRIEASECTTLNLEFASAVVVHNLGISYFCQAKTTADLGLARRILGHARNSFCTAALLLSVLEQSDRLLLQRLYFSIASQASYYHALTEVGSNTEAQHALKKLQSVKDVAQQLAILLNANHSAPAA